MRVLGRIAGGVVVVGLGAYGAAARAHSGGVGGGDCSGCHGSGDQMVSVFTQPGMLAPGQQATVTVQIASTTGIVAGLFVSGDAGTLEALAGEGVASVNGGISHTMPKDLSNDMVSFSFAFTPPAAPGAVRFEVWTNVANDNGSSSGDGASYGRYDFVYGCNGQTYYRDFDGDGYGRDDVTLLHCAGTAPDGYAASSGDCDDFRDTVYPTATEYCNGRDDDCDGSVDEDAVPVELFPDADGDGYYGSDEGQSEDTMLGCVPTEGYAADRGDCEPNNPDIHPGAEEICNLFDDNCDGRVDEWVRPRCGEGWCRRESLTCDAASCTPGEPMEEACNLLDDDCDGFVDEGELCAQGEVCVVGRCEPEDAGATTGTTAPGEDGSSDTGSAPSNGGKGCSVPHQKDGERALLVAILLGLAAARRRLRRGRPAG